MNLPDFSDGVPRAVAIDLDGTALNSTARLSPRTANAILALLNAEVPVVIATARPGRTIPKLTGPEIAERCSLVHLSGASGVGRHPLAGNVWSPIDRAEARLTWDIVTASPVHSRMTMELDGTRFAASHKDDADGLWAFKTATPDMVVSVEEAIEAGPAKISVSGRGNDMSDIVHNLRAELSAETIVVPSTDNSFINVLSASASKSGAVAALAESVGTDLSDVIGFGDDLPDIDLMTGVGWSVAVSNAIPEIKAAAEFHTASNDDDGVAIVLENMVQHLSDSGA